MGILMDFFAGDGRMLAAIEQDPEGAEIDLASAPFVRAHADFSLHLTPLDLDPLIAAAGARSGRPALALTSSFTRHLAGPTDPMEAEYAIDLVSPDVVETMAALPADQVHAVAEQWFRDIEAQLSPDAEEALRNLIRLCQIARAEHLHVALSWSL